MAKRKNQTDLTLRNLRAAKRQSALRDALVRTQIGDLVARVDNLEKRVVGIVQTVDHLTEKVEPVV